MTMHAMEYLVVASAKAGSAGEKEVEAVAGTLAAHGPTELVRTGDVDELDGALDRVNGRVLVVAGGDGSLHLVVQRLWDRGELNRTTVGLVPLGTGNDFARGLGLPLDPVEAASSIANARPRPTDLLVDDAGGVVVNVVHVGLGADAALDATALKGPLGPLAYPVGALLAGLRDRGWDLEISLDGTPLGAGAVLMVGIGNGRTIGGGTPLCAEALPDDGLLDVVVVNATGHTARVAFAAALRKGDHLGRDDVRHARGREVRVSGDPVCHDVDGEVSEELTARSYGVVPRAWSLLRP